MLCRTAILQSPMRSRSGCRKTPTVSTKERTTRTCFNRQRLSPVSSSHLPAELRTVLSFSDMSCARHTTRNPTSPIVISVRREKNVEQVIHCYMSTLQCVLERSRDFSLPRVWSVSRTISPHLEDLQALTTGGANFRAFHPIPNVLPECDAPRTRINREMTLQRRRQLSSHVSMNSCFALRIVTFWEPWRLLAVCPPSRTADASNFRIVWFSELSDTSNLMPPLGYTYAFEKKECLLLLKLCWNPISSVPFVLVRRSLVLRLPLCLLCERHPQRLRQRLVEWLSPLALGTHLR